MVDVSAKKIIGKPQSKDLDQTTTGYVLRVDDVLGSRIFPGRGYIEKKFLIFRIAHIHNTNPFTFRSMIAIKSCTR